MPIEASGAEGGGELLSEQQSLCGILPVDKPEDWTSHDVVAKLRGRLGQRRIGHAGTLDPMATGLLVVLVGKATRLMDLLPGDKGYVAQLRTGFTSDTLDSTGHMTATGAAVPPREAVEEALKKFTGPILQIPPMVSAVKVDGQRLYKLARKGIDIERKPRPVHITQLNLLSEAEPVSEGLFTIQVSCSSGTYIRTLIDDLGAVLGCGAVMTALRRVSSGPYTLEQACSLEQASAQRLMPVQTALPGIPALVLSAADIRELYQGKQLPTSQHDGLVWIRDEAGRYLALARIRSFQLKLHINLDG